MIIMGGHQIYSELHESNSAILSEKDLLASDKSWLLPSFIRIEALFDYILFKIHTSKYLRYFT